MLRVTMFHTCVCVCACVLKIRGEKHWRNQTIMRIGPTHKRMTPPST